MARVSLPESKVRARRRRQRVIILLWGGFALFFLFILVAWATWVPFVRIQRVEASGAQSVASSTVQKKVQDEIDGKYFLIFAKDNILLYPKGSIQHDLLTQFPIFKSVALHIKGFTRLEVEVVERKGVAVWCGESLASSSPCFLLDDSGVVYAPAADFSGNAYERYYGSVPSLTLPTQFLTTQKFKELYALIQALKNTPGLSIQSVSVNSDGDVRAVTRSGFVLLFVLNGASGDVYQRFNLALAAAPFTSHTLSDFEYLDLRFGDKLFYKLK